MYQCAPQLLTTIEPDVRIVSATHPNDFDADEWNEEKLAPVTQCEGKLPPATHYDADYNPRGLSFSSFAAAAPPGGARGKGVPGGKGVWTGVDAAWAATAQPDRMGRGRGAGVPTFTQTVAQKEAYHAENPMPGINIAQKLTQALKSTPHSVQETSTVHIDGLTGYVHVSMPDNKEPEDTNACIQLEEKIGEWLKNVTPPNAEEAEDDWEGISDYADDTKSVFTDFTEFTEIPPAYRSRLPTSYPAPPTVVEAAPQNWWRGEWSPHPYYEGVPERRPHKIVMVKAGFD
eukprot:Hpha_TRINITY_DN15309_c4_g7::TRINITY_DN15309_c4_g7_i1::g.88981::m.88981